MNVLHVIKNISPGYGGASKTCKELCSALASAGEKVTLYTTNVHLPEGRLDVPTNEPVTQDGYTAWYFPVQFPPYDFSADMAIALRRYAKEFDLIHIHGLYRFPPTVAAYYARRYGVPYIVRPHGSLHPFLFNRRRRRLTKRVYEYLVELRNLNKAAAIHFDSREEMILTQALGLKAPGIVVPNGLEVSEYESLPERGRFRERYNLNSKKIILHLGRINEVKGLDVLVKAFARVSSTREDVCLVIAGPDNDNYSKQLNRWLVQERVTEKTILTGMLQGTDKLAALSDADVFALPSYCDSFGMAVCEAMACGLPVVISDNVGIWREVEAAGAGLVTRCDVGEVARAMVSLLGNAERRRTMGMAGKTLVSNSYRWSSVVAALLKTYRAVVT